MSALAPIDRDESYQRDYIPLPGGWEIQTKGRGSSFRICDTKDGERWLVADEYLHTILERMAREIRAAYERRSTPAGEGVTEAMVETFEAKFLECARTRPDSTLRDDIRAALVAALARAGGK